MTYKNFIQEVIREVRCRLPQGTSVETRQVLKNNNLCLDGLIISEDSLNISPTIYLNDYYELYQRGTTTAEIAERILTCYRRHRMTHGIDVSFFTDFSKVQSRIVFRLIHRERNAALLKDVPYVPYLDLAIVFCCHITPPADYEGTASILIKNSHLPFWDATPELLMQHAAANTPRLLPGQLLPMQDILRELLPEQEAALAFPPTEEPLPMYILTNSKRLHGAACILYSHLLRQFADELQSDLIILPSSIHEVLLIPAKNEDFTEQFSSIIPEVNASCVAAEEILSDHPYYYHRASDSVRTC